MWMLGASAAYGATFGVGLVAGIQPGGDPLVAKAADVEAKEVEGGEVGEGLEPGGSAFKVVGLRAPVSLELGPRSALRVAPLFSFATGKTALTGAGVDAACANLASVGALPDDQASEGCVLASTAWRISAGLLVAPEVRVPLGGPAWAYFAPGAGAEFAHTYQDTDYGPWNGCTRDVRVDGEGCPKSKDQSPKGGPRALLDLAAGVMLRPDSGPGTWFELAYARTWDRGGEYPEPEGGKVSVHGYQLHVVRLGVGVQFGQSG